MDIFHPLSTIQWEQQSQLQNVSNANCIFLEGKLYVGGGYVGTDGSKILVSSADFINWSTMATPTRQQHFALTTFKSQLVLVGGKCMKYKPAVVSNKLWTRNVNVWEESLPPMQEERYWPSAINVSNPMEAIVVAGGRGSDGRVIDSVEVLLEEQWYTVQSLPKKCYGTNAIIYNEKLYLVGGSGLGRDIYFCRLSMITDKETMKSKNLWNSFARTPSEASCVGSFQHELIAVMAKDDKLFAYHAYSKSWVHVGDTPTDIRVGALPVSLPNGDMMVVGTSRVQPKGPSKMFMVTLKVSPYDPDSKFSRCSLSRIEEGAGIKVVTPLSKVHISLMTATGVEVSLDRTFSDESKVEKVIGQWTAGKCRAECPPTWKSLISVLNRLDLTSLGQQIEDHLNGKLDYLTAYRQVLAAHESIEMWFIKVVLLGPPRLGKTTSRRRLTGEIKDISSSGEIEQSSTGAVESAPRIVIRNLSSTTALVTPTKWDVVKDLQEEARLFLEFFYSHAQETMESLSPSSDTDDSYNFSPNSQLPKAESDTSDSPDSHVASDTMEHTNRNQSQVVFAEITDLIRKAVGPKYWKDVRHLFKDTAFLKIEDTGGQPEFMDLLPALTIGPALYLLFCRLIDDLKSSYTVSYLSQSGKSTTPIQSTYTVEELLLTALASISCFKSYSTPEIESHDSSYDELLSSEKSMAYVVGTFKDKVSEEEIDQFDKQLQQCIRSTKFFKDGLIRFSTEQRMILPVDNMSGGAEEIETIQSFLESGMKDHFKKLPIPAAWLVLSLCLRKNEERMTSRHSVLQLASTLDMQERETDLALWFLHHRAGVLMYFPNLEELKDTVICDTQIVYDSATNLIVNTFKFGKVSMAVAEKFRETGQFSLEDIKKATTKISGDYIPLLKLVRLLEHLNIIAPIAKSSPSTPPCPTATYFMPCILQNATTEEMDEWWKSTHQNSLAPLFIHYKCGFVPIGVFPAMIANLTNSDLVDLISENIKKNKVQFQFGNEFDMLTLVSHPKYYAVHITRTPGAEIPTFQVCGQVRDLIASTLDKVKSRMNYTLSMDYDYAFECLKHPGREHLCMVKRGMTSPRFMRCLTKSLTPVMMELQHLEWFKWDSEPQQQDLLYLSSLPASARLYLNKVLDWDHDGVDVDLNEIAYVMIYWEEKLSVPLGLGEVEIHDILKSTSCSELQRRKVLQTWKNNQGLNATYGNLLKIFTEAPHSNCAKALCSTLKRRCK